MYLNKVDILFGHLSCSRVHHCGLEQQTLADVIKGHILYAVQIIMKAASEVGCDAKYKYL